MSPGPGDQVEAGVGQAASLGVGSPHLQCCFDLLWNGSFLRVIFLRLCFGESLVTPVWLFLEPSAVGQDLWEISRQNFRPRSVPICLLATQASFQKGRKMGLLLRGLGQLLG